MASCRRVVFLYTRIKQCVQLLCMEMKSPRLVAIISSEEHCASNLRVEDAGERLSHKSTAMHKIILCHNYGSQFID